MRNSSNDQVCLEYLVKIDASDPQLARREVSKFLTSMFEDSHSSNFSTLEKDSAGTRFTFREYWKEREEFQKSKAYSTLVNLYDGGPDDSLLEPTKITFWDAKIGQFSIWL